MKPAAHGPENAHIVPAVDQSYRNAARRHFDTAYYLISNPDVRAAEVDPLDHFLLDGWREGRNPSRIFDVAYYLVTNPDVAASGMNPLLHYAWVGAQEGRLPRRPLDTARRHLEASSAPRERAPHWAAVADRSLPMSSAALTAALAKGAEQAGTIVSVSHDDNASSAGGVQNLIGDEQRAFKRAGWSYMHISPAAPLPMLAEPGPVGMFRIRVRLDGDFVGVASFQDMLDVVAALRGQGRRFEIVFHHLMGHAPELLVALSSATGARPVLWVHDFFTLCPSYTLMRNDVKFCGGPPPTSTACTICTFGPDRSAHLPRMQNFFKAVRPLVLAPSVAALDIWLRSGSFYHSGAEVMPLARLIMVDAGDEHAVPTARNNGPLRIAHLGARVMHKGWFVFEELALCLAGDARYKFYQLGINGGVPLAGCIQNIPVCVVAEQREAMIEAVAEHRIDVVISWSLWPETFCFAVHEALAGGAFVVARLAAGNVWPAVQANASAQGCAITGEAELVKLFISGEVLRLAARAQRSRGALFTGGGTADWLLRSQTEAAALPRRKAGVEGVVAGG